MYIQVNNETLHHLAPGITIKMVATTAGNAAIALGSHLRVVEGESAAVQACFDEICEAIKNKKEYHIITW